MIIDPITLPSRHRNTGDVLTTHTVATSDEDRAVIVAESRAGCTMATFLTPGAARDLARALLAGAQAIDGHGAEGCPTCKDKGWVSAICERTNVAVTRACGDC